MIGGDRVGDVVLARAGIRQVITDPKFCPPPGPCQNSELADVSAPNVVAVGWRTAPEGQGTRVTHGVIVRWLVRLSIPDGPVLGAFKILTDAVEYLGPVVDSDGGDIVWSVSDIQAGEHNVPADDLYAVEGWLVKTPPAPCPAPPDYGSGTDSAYWCGGSFVTQALTRPSSTPNVLDPGGLHVQWDSYDDFAPNPALDAQDGAEPRLGTYLVRSAGCPPVVMGECPVWSMVGRLDHLSPSAEAFPREIDGEPVLTVEEATARITSSDSAEPFLVGGWVVFVIGDCFEPPCGDGFLIRSRPLGRGGDSEFASLRLVVDETTGAFPIGMDPTVLRVHPHDPLAAECPPDCRLAIVVDDVVWPTSLPTPQPAPSGAVSDSPPLAVGNWTTLRIWVDVDGMDTAVLEPGQVIDPITPGMLPALPWIVTARTSTGRVLLTLTIRETDGWPSSPDPSGGSTVHGAAARVDLSCGRIDIWAGPPLAGPGPPQSFPPGDCDP
jgi:hypothetical protein